MNQFRTFRREFCIGRRRARMSISAVKTNCGVSVDEKRFCTISLPFYNEYVHSDLIVLHGHGASYTHTSSFWFHCFVSVFFYLNRYNTTEVFACSCNIFRIATSKRGIAERSWKFSDCFSFFHASISNSFPILAFHICISAHSTFIFLFRYILIHIRHLFKK